MATSGNIQTLFKNREQTEAIFPRTKTRAVTDDNGNCLDVILEDVVHIGDKVIDTSSVPVNVDTLGGIPAEDYATEAWVKNEIANIQAGEDVDLSGFASQDDITLLNKRINELDYPVDSVNEKTGAVVLNAEDVGAHPNTWLPTTEQIGAVSMEAFNAQTEAFLSHYVPFNASTICFSIKGKNLGFDARYPVTLHIASKMSYMGFIQFNMNATDGAPIEGAYMLYGNLPVVSFKYHTNGDTTTYLLQSYSWNFWGGVEVKTFGEFAVKGLNDTTLDSGTEMIRVKGVTPEQIGAAPAGYGLGGLAKDITGQDLNTITAGGQYYWDTAINSPVGQYGYMEVIVSSGHSLTQIVRAMTENIGCSVQRVMHSWGEWAEWEWVNPPMLSGVEYRTTERHSGKPVYALHGSYLSHSELASGQTVMIPTGVANMADCFKCFAKINGFYVTIGVTTNRTAIYQVTDGEIQLTSNDSYYGAGFTVSYTLYYTKTTD